MIELEQLTYADVERMGRRRVRRPICWIVGHNDQPGFFRDETGRLESWTYAYCVRCGITDPMCFNGGLLQWLQAAWRRIRRRRPPDDMDDEIPF